MLTPSLYPRSEFEKATNLQTVLNELIHNVAHDADFLRETLASTIKVDDFTAALFRIYETMLAEGAAQVRSSDPCFVHCLVVVLNLHLMIHIQSTYV